MGVCLVISTEFITKSVLAVLAVVDAWGLDLQNDI